MAAPADTKWDKMWDTLIVDYNTEFDEVDDDAKPFLACVSKRYTHTSSKREVCVKFPIAFPSSDEWHAQQFDAAKPLIKWWEILHPEFEPYTRGPGVAAPGGGQPKDGTIRVYKAKLNKKDYEDEKTYEYFNQREKVPTEKELKEFNAEKYYKDLIVGRVTSEDSKEVCSKCNRAFHRLFANRLCYYCTFPSAAAAAAGSAPRALKADELKGAVGMVFTKDGVNYEVRVPMRVGNAEDWEAGGKDNWSVALPTFEEWNVEYDSYIPDPSKQIFVAGPWPEWYGQIEVYEDAGPLEPMVKTNAIATSRTQNPRYQKLTDMTVFYYPSFAEDVSFMETTLLQTNQTLQEFINYPILKENWELIASYLTYRPLVDRHLSRFAELPRAVSTVFLALQHGGPSFLDKNVSELISPPAKQHAKRARDEVAEETDAKRQTTQDTSIEDLLAEVSAVLDRCMFGFAAAPSARDFDTFLFVAGNKFPVALSQSTIETPGCRALLSKLEQVFGLPVICKKRAVCRLLDKINAASSSAAAATSSSAASAAAAAQ